MSKELFFIGQEISLINVDERNLRKIDYDRYIEKIKFKSISMSNIHVKLLIKSNNSDQILGYIFSYDYNKIDQHIKIDCDLDEKYMNMFFEEIVLKFCNYLFTYFPIRKIYFEVCNIYENSITELLERISFKKEACLKEDTFYNNRYYDKEIFTLEDDEFFEVKNKYE